MNFQPPPLKLSLIIPTLDQSGAEKQLALLATMLPRDQFQIEVIALNRGGYYEQMLKQQQIPVHILGKRWRIDPVAHWRLRQQLQRFQPDLVHSWLFAANSHARLLKTKQAAWKCIVAERCVDSWKAGWQLAVDRWLLPRTQMMVANSQSVAEFYQQQGMPADLIRVIPNGIELPSLPDPDDPAHQQARREWRTQWGFPEDAFVIGYVGRLAAQKKVETLLWAMHMLKQAEPQSRALFVGSGPELERLQYLAEKYEVTEYIRFAGHRADAAEFHRYWDAFWLASEFEGQSNSLMEAMAAGLPVVVSEIPANQELVSPEQTGLLATVNSSTNFALKMRQVITSPTLAQTLGTQARAALAEHHSISRMVEQHRQLYLQLGRS